MGVDETDTQVEAILGGLPARYRPRRILGHGSQKCVYLAHDSTLDRDVAIAAIDLSRLGEAANERLHEARTMIVALTPYLLVKLGLRSESVGNDDDAIMQTSGWEPDTRSASEPQE